MPRERKILVIGLGNPWEEYRLNRHNVGQLFLDSVESKSRDIKLLKNDTFMNEAGGFVKKWATKYWPNETKLTNLYIVHDDLDIRLGEYKINLAKGPQLHYGIQSVEEALETDDFWRVRIGIDNRDPVNRTIGEDYVLQDFTREELQLLDNLFPRIWEDLQKKLT